MPPDSEVVAPFSLNGGQLGSCAVVVGHTLVDASTSSANVLMINPNAEEVALHCRTRIGQLVPYVGCVSGLVGITITDKRGSGATGILGGHCTRVTYLIGAYRSSVTAQFASSL